MKNRHPRIKALSLVCALALAFSLIPPVQAAGFPWTVDLMSAAPTFSNYKAVQDDGTLLGWGLGIENLGVTNVTRDLGLPYQNCPTPIASGYIACGLNWGVKQDHTLWMWGPLSCITGNSSEDGYTTTALKLMDNVKSAWSDDERTGTTLVLRTDGTLWGWGEKDVLLGNDAYLDQKVLSSDPIQLTDHVKQFDCNSGGWMAVKEDGTLWSCGYNGFGLIDYANVVDGSLPLHQIMTGVAAVSIDDTVLVIKKDGSLWSWGCNDLAQAGNGRQSDTRINLIPVSFTPTKILDNVVWAEAGMTGYAVTADGTLYGWGYNFRGDLRFEGGDCAYDGQLGSPYPYPCQSTPVKVMDNVAAIHQGMILKRDGTLLVFHDLYLPEELTDWTVYGRGVKLPVPDSSPAPSTPSSPSTPVTFSDIGGHWAKAEIERAAQLKIIEGTGNGTFNPGGNITYAQFAQLLVKVFLPDEFNSYSGAKSPWYLPACTIASGRGLFVGTAYRTPDQAEATPLPRMDMAVMIANTIRALAPERYPASTQSATAQIPDIGQYDAARSQGIAATYAMGIMQGVDATGRFNGTMPLDRAQAAVIIMRVYDLTKTGTAAF